MLRLTTFLLLSSLLGFTANAACLKNKAITAARNTVDIKLDTAMLKHPTKRSNYETIKSSAANACYVKANVDNKECEKVKLAYAKKGHKEIVLCQIDWDQANLVGQMLFWNIRPGVGSMKAALKIYSEIYQANQ
jgi:hypothetical protein